MTDRPPWVWALAGVAATLVVLGFLGQLESCAPIDRTLNPDARHYWQSEEDFHAEMVEWCAERYITLNEGSETRADAWVDSSIRGAVERGYLSRQWLRVIE